MFGDSKKEEKSKRKERKTNKYRKKKRKTEKQRKKKEKNEIKDRISRQKMRLQQCVHVCNAAVCGSMNGIRWWSI